MRIPADDLDGAFGEVRDEVSRRMQDSAGRSLPAEVQHGEEFELAGAGPPRAEAALARDAGTSQTTLSPAETAAQMQTTASLIAKPVLDSPGSGCPRYGQGTTTR